MDDDRQSVGAPAGMVFVPAGSYVMGAAADAEAGPPRPVTLPAFYLDRLEVSNADYAAFVAAGAAAPPHWCGPEPPPAMRDLPVTNITWHEAAAYARFVGKRLPTEAEWERAARGTDGRHWPWGDADDPARRNLGESNVLAPVESHPEGAAPCGALNLCGNAWEWVADWFAPYPDGPPSPFDGRKYKVLRGGGAIYLYGVPNHGAGWQRARLVPYGRHDAIGFRCACSVDPADEPYRIDDLLVEAALPRIDPPTRRAAWRGRYEAQLAAGAVPIRVHGRPDRREVIRFGFPLPAGHLRDAARLGVAVAGELAESLAQVVVRWPDGSVRWAWIDAPLRPGEPAAVLLDSAPPAPASVAPSSLGDALRLGLRAGLGDQPAVELVALPPDDEAEEASSPSRPTIRRRGALAGPDGAPWPLRYDLRLTGTGRTGEARLTLSLTHLAPREGPSIRLEAAWLRVPCAPGWVRLGREQGPAFTEHAVPLRVEQLDDLRYTIDGTPAGTRLPGWIAVAAGDRWLSLAVRDFAAKHPSGLEVADDGVVLRLWAGATPFEWEGGLAVTWELLLAEGAEPLDLPVDPPRVALDADWVAGTEAAGRLRPRDADALATLAYWEAAREHDCARWVRAMPTGLRDWGDAYFGGPYKGRNAFANLEYDVPLNFLWQYLRTGEAWYLRAAEAQVRHQADIDVDWHTGRQWKHSPQHTTTEAEWGHVFLRGLLLHYCLTGDHRSREAAEAVGEWLAPRMAAFEGFGNERQIGWSLFALTGLAEVGDDPRWLGLARGIVAELHRRQEPTGRFQIRWDNRVAFFNGIAANGLLHVLRLTGDPACAEVLTRLCERTLGVYPEYAARTLNVVSHLAIETGDPRWRDALARSWESTLAFLLPFDTVAAETHGHEFAGLAVEQGWLSERCSAEARLDPATWRFLRLRHRGVEKARHAADRFAPDAVDLYLRGETGAAVLLVSESLADAAITLSGPDGLAPRLDDGWPRCASFTLPAAGTWRLRLAGAAPTTWQVHTDGRCRVVLADPAGRFVPSLYPAAWSPAKAGADRLRLTLEARGEGYQSGCLSDPAGRTAAVLRHFIDLGDVGRYELELGCAVPSDAPAGCWSAEVHGARVLSCEGLGPYWSARPEDWFNPEQSP